jgi:hypothetical protein
MDSGSALTRRPTSSRGRHRHGPLGTGPARRPGCPGAGSSPGECRLDAAEPPLQHRTWNLSCIWSIPVRESPGSRGRLWLKCVPGFFAYEACVLRRLSAEAVPRLVAAQDHRLLLGDLPGRDGFDATPDEAEQVIKCLVGLQIRTVPLVPSLLADGVPDARSEALVQQLQAVVARRAPDNPILRHLAGSAGKQLAQAQSCGLPDVLVHGDAHPGNARIGLGTPILFDWGDARIGNPVLDLAVLNRLHGPARDALADYWLRTWNRRCPAATRSKHGICYARWRPCGLLPCTSTSSTTSNRRNGSTTRRTCAQRSRSPPASPLTTPGDDAEASRSLGGRRRVQDLSRFGKLRDMCPAWRPLRCWW